MSCILAPAIVMLHWSADAFLDSCQLTITWMSTIKSKRGCICLGNQANNVQSLQGNNACLATNQSARTIVAI